MGFLAFKYFSYSHHSLWITPHPSTIPPIALYYNLTSRFNPAYIQAEHWSPLVAGQNRDSVRITSHALYSGGLFLIDLASMPWGCGVWPACKSIPELPHPARIIQNTMRIYIVMEREGPLSRKRELINSLAIRIRCTLAYCGKLTRPVPRQS